MKTVEMWKFKVRDLTGRKWITTRHLMPEADALAAHPEAVKVPGTMELRQIAETEAEVNARFDREPHGPYPGSK